MFFSDTANALKAAGADFSVGRYTEVDPCGEAIPKAIIYTGCPDRSVVISQGKMVFVRGETHRKVDDLYTFGHLDAAFRIASPFDAKKAVEFAMRLNVPEDVRKFHEQPRKHGVAAWH